jgi:hypothetical protein
MKIGATHAIALRSLRSIFLSKKPPPAHLCEQPHRFTRRHLCGVKFSVEEILEGVLKAA